MKTKLEKIYDCIPAAIDRKIEAVIAKHDIKFGGKYDEPGFEPIKGLNYPNNTLLDHRYNLQRAAMTQDPFHLLQASQMRAMSQDEIAELNYRQWSGQIGCGGSAGGLFGGKWI